MKFCPNCDNILIPKDKKLFCKVCNQEFALKPDCINEYKIRKMLKHEEDQFIILEDKKNLHKHLINCDSYEDICVFTNL